ncbi:hypothetical protein PoB_007545900 [Plakobranchus ocellatus]|uniref:Uncharacterized protein n=1 Tax=Plakobranchus ocellatus TaxID=259542 RepID=A0AAV4DXL8_9GAST|nr:hypothetical protein PoB_007545900 [Plakobranchus ocellatus]
MVVVKSNDHYDDDVDSDKDDEDDDDDDDDDDVAVMSLTVTLHSLSCLALPGCPAPFEALTRAPVSVDQCNKARALTEMGTVYTVFYV